VLPIKDFVEFIESLNKAGVEYLVVGAFAVGFHARPRETSDLDVWVRASEENLHQVWLALKDFGMTIDRGPRNQPILQPGETLQLGYPPARIDMLTQISGVDFADAWQHRVPGVLFGQNVSFLSLDDLKANKLASGRSKDLHDLNTIDRITKARSPKDS
jgi:hypothetical protein